MVLFSGPLCTDPSLQSVAPNAVGTCTPVKSSAAVSLNSTRIVSSLASWVALAPLYWLLIALGLLPVRIDFASSFASSRAATGLPWACLASNAMARAMASPRWSTALPLLDTWTSSPKAASTCGAA